MKLNWIDNHSCIETMNQMPDNFLDLTICSPPYDNLRKYKNTCDEKTWNLDVFKKVASGLYRVTKQGGVVVWVVGDAVIKGGETGSSFRQALYFQELGFLIHDTMIYEKNGTSFPARKDGNRYSQIFEYMFVFSKGKPKTANLICDKKNRWAGFTSFGQCKIRDKHGELKERTMKPVPDFSPRNNIWRYNTGKNYSTKDEIAFAHPAIFPEALAADHIQTWSNPGDTVFDCFAGSGTTLKCAKILGRNYIGSEIVPEYVEIAEQRLALV